MTTKKKGLSRQQAAELYKDLQRTMAKMLKNEAEYYKSKGMAVPLQKKAAPAAHTAVTAQAARTNFAPALNSFNKGSRAAVVLLVFFALSKVVMSGLEYSGVAAVTKAEASMVNFNSMPRIQGPQFSKEELQVLTALDGRRAELEERSRRLDEKEQDISKKDREFAVRMTQLRELTDRLSNERDKNDRRKHAQLEQLANVYSSMNPQEAAKLMEQLDIVTAMNLIERMPEKRIAQILSMMSADRALEITRLLSGRVTK